MIETVITPREGCKLVVRSSKGVGQEEFSVDAVEVVSFGHSVFFRSLERPGSFLVPVSDYEIFELKETRVPLKAMGGERSIKIGGGRDSAPRREREPREAAASQVGEEAAPMRDEASTEAYPPSYAGDRGPKQGRRRSRRRRGGGGGGPGGLEHRQEGSPSSEARPESSLPPGEEAPAPSFISKLFPPPTTLIKETLSRYKTTEEGITVEEKPSFNEELPPADTDSELSSIDDETKFED
jgi:hypothetical protein